MWGYQLYPCHSPTTKTSLSLCSLETTLRLLHGHCAATYRNRWSDGEKEKRKKPAPLRIFKAEILATLKFMLFFFFFLPFCFIFPWNIKEPHGEICHCAYANFGRERIMLSAAADPSQDPGSAQRWAPARSHTTVKTVLNLKVQLCCGTNIQLLPAHPPFAALHYLNFIVWKWGASYPIRYSAA